MALSTQEQLLLAARVASRAHGKQVRKDGTPYISHCVRVMIRVRPHGIYCEIGALLHDVVEDTRGKENEITIRDLHEDGFDDMVLAIVDHVTRREGESYSDFINRCAEHDYARLLKIEDIGDNLEDQSALEPEEADFLRKRYLKALTVLT